MQKNRDDENGHEDDFNLYTENIVTKPFEKYRKLIKAVKLIVAAIVFGVVACFVFVSIYPKMSYRYQEGNKTEIVIPRDEYPEDSVDIQDNADLNQGEAVPEDIVDNSYDVFQKVIQSTNKSMVVVFGKRNGEITDVDPITEKVGKVKEKELALQPEDIKKIDSMNDNQGTAGLIIANTVGSSSDPDDGEYIILTEYAEVKDSDSIKVDFGDGILVKGTLIKGNEDIGIATIYVSYSAVTGAIRNSKTVASLDNSYIVKQGDMVVVAGRIYGNTDSVDYGVVTNVKLGDYTIADNYYGILCTSISRYENDYGYLFNSSGNVIGVLNSKNDTANIMAYGISDLKILIEELSNNSEAVYCGIKGKTVSTSMAEEYKLPYGIYVTEVEDNSPAFNAGIQAGDIITKINKESALTFRVFSEKLYKHNSGQSIIITAKRQGKDDYREIEFTVMLDKR